MADTAHLLHSPELNIGKLEDTVGYYWEVTTEELKLWLTQG